MQRPNFSSALIVAKRKLGRLMNWDIVSLDTTLLGVDAEIAGCDCRVRKVDRYDSDAASAIIAVRDAYDALAIDGDRDCSSDGDDCNVVGDVITCLDGCAGANGEGARGCE